MFVRGLPAAATAAELRSVMAKFGPLKACRWPFRSAPASNGLRPQKWLVTIHCCWTHLAIRRIRVASVASVARLPSPCGPLPLPGFPLHAPQDGGGQGDPAAEGHSIRGVPSCGQRSQGSRPGRVRSAPPASIPAFSLCAEGLRGHLGAARLAGLFRGKVALKLASDIGAPSFCR